MKYLYLFTSISVSALGALSGIAMEPESNYEYSGKLYNKAQISAEEITDFAQLAYKVSKNTWKKDYDAYRDRIEKAGWSYNEESKIKATTGTASFTQSESVFGLISFKDDQVVIATRGTDRINDLATDGRERRWGNHQDPQATGMQFLADKMAEQLYGDAQGDNKEKQFAAQIFEDFNGINRIGFTQTHLSMRKELSQKIKAYAASIGKAPADLKYTLTGHSLGGVEAILNALWLISDRDLGIGKEKLDASFVDTSMTESGFHGLATYETAQNQGNVQVVVFGMPGFTSSEGAVSIDAILGKDNITCVANGNDPVKDMLRGQRPGVTVEIAPVYSGFKAHSMEVYQEGSEKILHELGFANQEPTDPKLSGLQPQTAQPSASDFNQKSENVKVPEELLVPVKVISKNEIVEPVQVEKTVTSVKIAETDKVEEVKVTTSKTEPLTVPQVEEDTSFVGKVKNAATYVAQGASNFFSGFATGVKSVAQKIWGFFK